MIGIVHSKYRAIADHNLAARIDKHVRRLRLPAARCPATPDANHADRVSMKLVDGHPHLPQRLAELLLLLPLHRNFHERQYTERHNRKHGERDHQLDQ